MGGVLGFQTTHFMQFYPYLVLKSVTLGMLYFVLACIWLVCKAFHMGPAVLSQRRPVFARTPCAWQLGGLQRVHLFYGNAHQGLAAPVVGCLLHKQRVFLSSVRDWKRLILAGIG